MRELISSEKKKKERKENAGGEGMVEQSPDVLGNEEKATTIQ